MTYPTTAVTTTNLDASTDSPASARSDILDAIQKLNQMIAHTTAFAATLLDDANAATARATLGAAASGANTDITSLNGVSLSKGAGTGASNIGISPPSFPALVSNTTGAGNISLGKSMLPANTSGFSNIALTQTALDGNTMGYRNFAAGEGALQYNNTGDNNIGIGFSASNNNQGGRYNVAIGNGALKDAANANYNTAIGFSANTNSPGYSNCAGIGANASPGGSNQMRLGDSATTVYTQSGTVSASDVRDKADIRDTTLGLGFINSLRPVDYKWDIRIDYAPTYPEQDDYETTEEYRQALRAHAEASRPGNLEHDGSKKRARYHHGLIAQEVGALVAATGVDFGGYQDFEVKGGEALQAVAYEELIAPLIKAVQELSATVAAQAARIEALEAA